MYLIFPFKRETGIHCCVCIVPDIQQVLHKCQFNERGGPTWSQTFLGPPSSFRGPHNCPPTEGGPRSGTSKARLRLDPHAHYSGSRAHHLPSGKIWGCFFVQVSRPSGFPLSNILTPAAKEIIPQHKAEGTSIASSIKTRSVRLMKFTRARPTNGTRLPASRATTLLDVHGIHAKLRAAPKIGHGVFCLCAFEHGVPSAPNAFACLDHLANFQPFLDTEAAKTEMLHMSTVLLSTRGWKAKFHIPSLSCSKRWPCESHCLVLVLLSFFMS